MLPFSLSDAQAIVEFFRGMKNEGPRIKQFVDAMMADFFYREDLIQALLFNQDLSKLGRTEFIDYTKYVDYYASSIETVRLRAGSEERTLKLPYKTEIDLVANPTVRVYAPRALAQYQMSAELVNLTQPAYEAFLRQKPTTDPRGTILRVASLTRQTPTHYECALERSKYEFQIRTNLTLDYPLRGVDAANLRVYDLDRHNDLRPLSESVMVNSLGVSAVVFYVKDGKRHFYMKTRQKGNGVFETMLGSTSGVVQVPGGQQVPELISYGEVEMLREFRAETGLEDQIPLDTLEIIPLAFCRELTRGGKPQLFYLIEISHVSDTVMRKLFAKSREGKLEFLNGLVADRTTVLRSMSPELIANIVLAQKYFQIREKLPIDVLRLG